MSRRPDEVDLLDGARAVVGNGWVWIAAWLVSRAWMLREWGYKWRPIANDVRYYYFQMAQGDPQVVLREYPLPVLWFLDLLRFPAAEDVNLYLIAFCLTMALLDAGFAYWLWASHSRVASIFWMVFVFAMGSLVWFRYDLLPGVVVGAAVLFTARRPAVSGALVALGAGIKLWPALLVAPLLGRDRSSLRRTTGFVVTGFALALAALLDAGFARLVSPLTWQSERGLQIESVWATPLMWDRAFGTNPRTTVQMSPFNAFEVYGPGAEGLQKAASICMALAVLYCVAVALAAFTHSNLAAHQRAMAATSIVSAMLVANKTLSPQYIVWLGAVAAAWLALSPRGQRRRAALTCAASLVLAVLTQYVYPVAYPGLLGNPTGEPKVTLVLAARNLLLVGLCCAQIAWTADDLLSGRRSGVRHVAEVVESTDSIPDR